MAIYCARCKSRVGVIRPCRNYQKWPGGFDERGRPLLNEANDRANAARYAKRKAARAARIRKEGEPCLDR